MNVLFLILFIPHTFAQETCVQDKTFVSLQPILKAGKIAEKAAADDRFKHRDHEDLTDEKFGKFKQQMSALYEKGKRNFADHEAKIAELKKTITGIFERRSEEVHLVDDDEDLQKAASQENIDARKAKLAAFRSRFKDQLSDRFESLGRFKEIKASLISMDQQIAQDEAKMDVMQDHYMDLTRSIFDHDGKRSSAPKK